MLSIPEDVAAEVYDRRRAVFAEEKGTLEDIGCEYVTRPPQPKITTYLGVEDDPSPFIDPKILFDEATVLEGQETVGEADETVRRVHGSEREDAKGCKARKGGPSCVSYAFGESALGLSSR